MELSLGICAAMASASRFEMEVAIESRSTVIAWRLSSGDRVSVLEQAKRDTAERARATFR
jgi:hypothetical protein